MLEYYNARIDNAMNDMVGAYKVFHAAPELSMQEVETSRRIVEWLQSVGVEVMRFGKTGLVGIIRNGSGPVVAYRADIDALPIAEATGLTYASQAEGVLPDGTRTKVMHGCGHDVHITVGLFLARMLVESKEGWAGTALLIFQPGEETAQGAQSMLDAGLWQKLPKPVAIYGQHDWAGETGHIFIKPGTAMALSDCLKVHVKGRQAHGSKPEDAIDPIVLGAFMVTRLQTVVSREIAGTEAAVVTIGTFHAGLKENIIPDSAEFTLNIRTFNDATREKVLAAVSRIIKNEAKVSGAPEPVIEQLYKYPRCYNDVALTESLMTHMASELGKEMVHLDEPHTGSEDFGAFGDSIGVPYVFWHFGVYSKSKYEKTPHPAGIHSPLFATDDIATTLKTGVSAALIAFMLNSKLSKASL